MEKVNFTKLANFQPKQLEAWEKLFDPKCKYFLYGGAAGGGKSYFLRWAALGLGLYYTKKYDMRGVTIGLFSEDYPTLRDRQVQKIKSEFPDYLGKLKETRDEGYVFKANPKYGGFNILLRNLDDPSKYASVEFAAQLVEELTKNKKETFDDLRFRLRYPGVNDVKFVSATNPGEIGHGWVKKAWIDPDPKDPDLEQDRFFFLPAKVYDNKFINAEYVTQLKSLPEQKRKAWLEGSWDVFAGQVFVEFSRNKHVIKPFNIPKGWERYISMDFGINAPSAILWYAVDYDGRIYVYRELYVNSMDYEKTFGEVLTPKRLARKIMQITEDNKEEYRVMYADPSLWNRTILRGQDPHKPEGESIAELMMEEGISMVRSDNDRLSGLQRFREALSPAPDKKPWLQIFENCYNTIRTIPSLVYDKNRVEDVDTQGEDHIYDSIRYFLMSRTSESIKQEDIPPTMMQSHYERVVERVDYDEDVHNRTYEEWISPQYLE